MSGSLRQQEIAQYLRLSTRQVKNLTDAGVLLRDAGLRYDLGENFARYLQYREEGARKRGSATKEEILTLQARKLETEIAANEYALEQARGQLVTLDYMESQHTGLLEALRARCLNAPGKWALQVAEATGSEPAAVLPLLEQAVADLLQTLAESGDDPDLDIEDEEEDAPSDPPDGKTRVA